jgi:uncharacterized peroxidase-related enzyme
MTGERELRIAMVEERDAGARERAAFDAARGRFGWLPNTIRVMVRSGSAAEVYLAAGQLNAGTNLTSVEREAVAIATATHNRCDYCLVGHGAALAAAGSTPAEVQSMRDGTCDDPRVGAILAFARAILDHRGGVGDAHLDAAYAAGLDHGTLLDIAAVVAENTLGNYVNNIARTPVDPVLMRAAVIHLAPAAVRVSR